MIPLKRAFDEKRRLVIPVAAGLAINVILFVGVVYPMRARVRNAELREQSATAALAAAQREDQSARGLVQGKTRTSTALRAFYHDVLPASQSSAVNLTYLRLQQLAEQHHLRIAHRNFEPEPNPKGALRRWRGTMAIEGSYDEVRRFIYDVETGTDFIVIDGVTLSQSSEVGGPLLFTLNLSTYYKYGE
jgi:predicted small secreted protein